MVAIEKTNRINALFDFYEPLLTVYDNIKRTEKILEEYEKKLGLYRQFEQQSQKTDEVLDYVKNKYPDDRKLIELVENLEKMEE